MTEIAGSMGCALTKLLINLCASGEWLILRLIRRPSHFGDLNSLEHLRLVGFNGFPVGIFDDTVMYVFAVLKGVASDRSPT